MHSTAKGWRECLRKSSRTVGRRIKRLCWVKLVFNYSARPDRRSPLRAAVCWHNLVACDLQSELAFLCSELRPLYYKQGLMQWWVLKFTKVLPLTFKHKCKEFFNFFIYHLVHFVKEQIHLPLWIEPIYIGIFTPTFKLDLFLLLTFS